MLSKAEKENLYKVIVAVIGEDISIKGYTYNFNERTVSIVEKMVEEAYKCNASMKRLVTNLIKGPALFSSGWLKKGLAVLGKTLPPANLKGYGCLVAVKSKWKQAILISTI